MLEPRKGLRARQQFVEHQSQAEDVGPAIDQVPFAAGLLRAHVDRRARAFPMLTEVLFPSGRGRNRRGTAGVGGR